jgi:hypothetical protein
LTRTSTSLARTLSVLPTSSADPRVLRFVSLGSVLM